MHTRHGTSYGLGLLISVGIIGAGIFFMVQTARSEWPFGFLADEHVTQEPSGQDYSGDIARLVMQENPLGYNALDLEVNGGDFTESVDQKVNYELVL